jgi:hypothetical protein
MNTSIMYASTIYPKLKALTRSIFERIVDSLPTTDILWIGNNMHFQQSFCHKSELSACVFRILHVTHACQNLVTSRVFLLYPLDRSISHCFEIPRVSYCSFDKISAHSHTLRICYYAFTCVLYIFNWLYNISCYYYLCLCVLYILVVQENWLLSCEQPLTATHTL